MGRRISLHLYHVEPVLPHDMGWLYNRVAIAAAKSVDVEEIDYLTKYNSGGAPSLAGLPYLYTKITFKQPALNQEVFVMQTVAALDTAINA